MLAALLFGKPRAALCAGMGAVLALQFDPRRSIPIRVAAVMAALVLIVSAGTLGVLLKDDKVAMTVAVIAISFLAGLPKPFFPYLSLRAGRRGANRNSADADRDPPHVPEPGTGSEGMQG